MGNRYLNPFSWIYVCDKNTTTWLQRSVTDKSPIVSIQAKNDNDYKRTDEIRPDDFVVTAKHKKRKKHQQ